MGLDPRYEPWRPRWGIFSSTLYDDAMKAKAAEFDGTLPALVWLDNKIEEGVHWIQCAAPYTTIANPLYHGSHGGATARRRLDAGGDAGGASCN